MRIITGILNPFGRLETQSQHPRRSRLGGRSAVKIDIGPFLSAAAELDLAGHRIDPGIGSEGTGCGHEENIPGMGVRRPSFPDAERRLGNIPPSARAVDPEAVPDPFEKFPGYIPAGETIPGRLPEGFPVGGQELVGHALRGTLRRQRPVVIVPEDFGGHIAEILPAEILENGLDALMVRRLFHKCTDGFMVSFRSCRALS